MDTLKVILDNGALMPNRAHPTDAGLDLYSPTYAIVYGGGRTVIDTGVHVEIPEGYVGKLESKSGLMRNAGITVRGTIDAGYTGTIQAVVFNHSEDTYTFDVGDKVCQLVIYPIVTPTPIEVSEFATTERGDSGFGSTGR